MNTITHANLDAFLNSPVPESKPKLAPTPEQAAIIAAAKDTSVSLMVSAYAGCGKTTTLELIANALPPGPALALAFNVKIKKELEKRFPSNFTILTMNGLGHQAFGRSIGKRLVLDERKLGKTVTAVTRRESWVPHTDDWTALRELVTAAMQNGLIPVACPHKGLVEDTEDNWRVIADANDIDLPQAGKFIYFAQKILQECINQSMNGVISFDDQVYMSTMFNGVFPRFPLVLVDESQDLSPLNHIQVRRCAADRLIVVGDKKQSIYAFRGADSASIEKLRGMRDEWIDLPLATTFRCPKIMVERQQKHAKGFKAYETNKDGIVVALPEAYKNEKGELIEPDTWTWEDALAHADGEIAILCRNNAPLMSMAFKLIRSGVACQMLGRDIGKGLVTLSKKLLPLDDIPAKECLNLIIDWRDEEASKAKANEQDRKVDSIMDRAACLLAVLQSNECKTAGELRRSIEALFAKENERVTLSTGHKAKGLEWDTVIHLDPHLCPAKWAEKKGGVALEQELNLRYVIETRTKNIYMTAHVDTYE